MILMITPRISQTPTQWCKNNNLLLNPSKTKELIINFRQRPTCQYPVPIDGTEVEIAQQYKYLGVVVDDRLRWDNNVNIVCRKGQQRLYFLRKLKTFNMDSELLGLFYSSMVQSVTSYALICWWGNLTIKNRKKIERIRKTAEKIIGLNLVDINTIYKNKVMKMMNKMVDGKSLFSNYIVWLKSGRRLQSLKCRANRYSNSFVPQAIRLFNAQSKGNSINFLFLHSH